jgi:hypothetical protein|tara:strand:+ start:135 stop:329 length:195 start_codon:yes stop_codon:yes gene_type:complete
MVKTPTHATAEITLPAGDVVEVLLPAKSTWGKDKVSKDGFYAQITSFAYNGKVFKGSIMIYEMV